MGTLRGSAAADLKELFPYADGSALVGVVVYALNSVITTYPEFEDVDPGDADAARCDLLHKVQDQCIAETLTKFMFRHLQPYFNRGHLRAGQPGAVQRRCSTCNASAGSNPTAPVMILSNRYDPLVPWTAANQLGRDWCAQGADVQFCTNEQPPFLNKLVVNHALSSSPTERKAAVDRRAGSGGGRPRVVCAS